MVPEGVTLAGVLEQARVVIDQYAAAIVFVVAFGVGLWGLRFLVNQIGSAVYGDAYRPDGNFVVGGGGYAAAAGESVHWESDDPEAVERMLNADDESDAYARSLGYEDLDDLMASSEWADADDRSSAAGVGEGWSNPAFAHKDVYDAYDRAHAAWERAQPVGSNIGVMNDADFDYTVTEGGWVVGVRDGERVKIRRVGG